MATINNMLSGTSMLFQSAYSSDSLFGNSNNSNRQNSISTLWNNYGSFQSNANSSLSGLSMISANVSSLVSSYDTTKKTFYSEFDETIDDLQKAAENIKNYNFDVGKDALTTTETTDEEGNKTTTTKKSDALVNALKTVEDLASKYNDTIKFLSDNSDVSKRVGRMNTMFADTTYRRANYESIGLQVASDGTMKIDEDKLAKAITEDPDKVSSILGKGGLADKAEDHISIAKGQRDNLFPSAQTLIGKDLSSAAIYTGTSYRNMSNYASVGNLINLMF